MNLLKKLHKDSKGFTMAELLIVVAIIAVLVAIAIPTFSAQLIKAREATDLANVRSYYADRQAEYLGSTGSTYNPSPVSVAKGGDLEFTDGTKVKMQAGSVAANFTANKGWKVTYTTDRRDASDNTKAAETHNFPNS